MQINLTISILVVRDVSNPRSSGVEVVETEVHKDVAYCSLLKITKFNFLEC